MSAGGRATEAIVLRVIPFGETSQVVHFATPREGLVAALAKGALRAGGEFQGGLALGTVGEAWFLARRDAELAILRRFRMAEDWRGLGADLERFFGACYVLDLLRAWMRPSLPIPALYHAGVQALRAMARAPADALPLWTVWFEARAVAAAGHRPTLEACGACGGATGPGAVFSPAAGGLAHPGCAAQGPRRRPGAEGLAALRRLYTQRAGEIAAEPPGPRAVREVRALHDLWIPHLLERRPESLARLPR